MSKTDYKPLPAQDDDVVVDVESQAAPPPVYAEVADMNFKPQSREGGHQEDQDWEIGLCGCLKDHKANFCLACCLPSAAFGIVSSRLKHYKENGTPHPTKGTVVNKDSGMHFGASLAAMIPPLTGFPLPLGLIASALEWRVRTDTRAVLGVKGSHVKDGLAVLFCQPCALTQEMAQLDRAEREHMVQLDGAEGDIIVDQPQPAVMTV